MIKKIQTSILKRGLESGIAATSKGRSPALTAVFTSVGERLKIDKNFEIQVARRAGEANLLKSKDFKRLLTSGLEKLENKDVIKPEEKNR